MHTRFIDVTQLESSSSDISSILKLLSNQHRLLTVCHLIKGELCVGELESRLNISQSSLSQHLGRLREQGIVEFRKESTTVYYRLADEKIIQLMKTLQTLYCDKAE